MRRVWSGAVRAALVAASGGGLVFAAATVPGTVALRAAGGPTSAPAPTLVAVRSDAVSCPGPETEGLSAVPPVAGAASVLVASAPAEALKGVELPPGEGLVTLKGMPDGRELGRLTARGTALSRPLAGPTVGDVTAVGSLAPGVAAVQSWVRTQGEERGLVTAACQPARPDLWLVGGGGQGTRRERIVVTNPGANAVSVDVVVYGGAGPVPSANGLHVAVPPHGRVTQLLDAIAGGEQTPVVHVSASGGVVTAVLDDSWIDGAVGRGADDAVAAQDPATEQVIPAAFVDGPARMRVLVPGAEEAVVQTRVLTTSGPQPLPADGVVRVAGGTVRDIDLGGLPPGAYALQVRADKPVVAGAMLERRGGPKGASDLAWTTSTAPVPVVAGAPLVPGAKGQLMLVATGDTAGGTVYTVSSGGVVTGQDVALQPDSVAVVDISGMSQVWVRQTAGTLRAGLSVSLEDKNGPLFSVVPLGPLTVSTTEVPVREVPG